MKIAVIGYSGSGKSTLAKALGKHHGVPVLYLDTVHFKENWTYRDRDECRDLVGEFMARDAWVIDGNYLNFRFDERMAEADQVIFLDFPRLACLASAVKRYFQYKNKTRESMADGCPEKLDLRFIWWILYEGRTRDYRARYRGVAAAYPDKTLVFKTRRRVNGYLASLGEAP